jgi:(2Fe-2S) ferredoxin
LSRFKFHIFVCTNTRPEGGKPACAGSGIVAALQSEIAKHEQLWDQVSVTATGCLGPCFDGPTAVVYGWACPEGVWYAGLQASDAAEIVGEHLVSGRPVERLRYHWPDR